MRTKTGLLLGMVLIVSGCTKQPTIGEMQFAEGSVQHTVLANEIQWNTCPPGLPSGCEIAVLEGDPKGSDLFSVRFRLSGEFLMPPHSHPKDERVTVLSGRMSVAFGEDATWEDATHFEPGDYYVNAHEAIHTVWADTLSVIQITGIGPWEANFIEEQDSD